MAGYTKTKLVASLLRAMQEFDYIPPPSRGGFSATRRTINSILATEGRDIKGSSSAVTYAGQSGGTVLAGGDTTYGYVAEFTIVALSGTTGSIGIVGDDGDGTGNTAYSFGMRSSVVPYGVGDVIGVVLGFGVFQWFKNGLAISGSGSAGGTVPYHFFACCDPSDPGTFEVMVESRLDTMVYADQYNLFCAPNTLTDWPFTAPAPDGAPPAPGPAPGPPAATPGHFDSFRVSSGTLSNSDKTLSTAATSGAKAAAEITSGLRRQHLADPSIIEAGFAIEFTVDNAPAATQAIMLITGESFGSFTIDYNRGSYYKADGANFYSTAGTTTSAWAVGDKIGMVVYAMQSSGCRVAFFKNGTAIGHGPMYSFFAFGPRFRGAAQMTTSAAVAASMTVQCDIALMTYGTAYAAYRESGYSMIDAISWPEADVLEALATQLTISPDSQTIITGGTSGNFAAAADGRLPAVVTVTPHSSVGSDVFSPTTLSLDDGSRSGNFTVTSSTTGVRTITLTNDGSLTNPAAVSLSVMNLTTLTSGVPATGLSGGDLAFKINVASGTNLNVTTSGGSGDVDLYIRFTSLPSTTSYDNRSKTVGSNSETLNRTINSFLYGDWYIYLNGASAFSGVTLTATVT